MIEADRTDGYFVILWVSPGAWRDGYRARVRREDGLEASVDISSTAISSDQKTILQKSEWEKRTLYMRINTRVRRGKIVSARLIQAGMEDRSKTNRTSRDKFNKHPLELPSNQMIDDYSR